MQRFGGTAQRSLMQSIIAIFLAMSLVSACNNYRGEPRFKEAFVFDFESDTDLDWLSWQCHQMYSLSDSHATHGAKSLKLEHFPSAYPGLRILLAHGLFKDKNAIVWDTFNPGKDTLTLHVRIDDRRNSPQYADRYNTSLQVYPGANSYRLNFADMITPGTRRILERERISAIYLFLHQPEQRVVLYYDLITTL